MRVVWQSAERVIPKWSQTRPSGRVAMTLPDTPRGLDLSVSMLAELNTTSLLSMTSPSRLPALLPVLGFATSPTPSTWARWH